MKYHYLILAHLMNEIGTSHNFIQCRVLIWKLSQKPRAQSRGDPGWDASPLLGTDTQIQNHTPWTIQKHQFVLWLVLYCLFCAERNIYPKKAPLTHRAWREQLNQNFNFRLSFVNKDLVLVLLLNQLMSEIEIVYRDLLNSSYANITIGYDHVFLRPC